MYGYILKPTDSTPLYYCYEVIYDNPILSIDDISKYYYKSSKFNFEDCENFESLYELLQDNHIIRQGDIILLNKVDYYFYAKKMIKIKN